MSSHKEKLLNRYHVIFLVQSAMVGTGILTLPRDLSAVGYSQLLFPLLFGLIATLTLWPIIWLHTKFPNENLFRINEILLGKGLGRVINLFIILHYTLLIAGVIYKYMHLIQSNALPEQTITMPVLLLILLLIYIVNGGIKSIARFCILSFFLTIGIFYFTNWAIAKGDIRHFLPLFNFSSSEFFNAFKTGYLTIFGYELIMFYFPYIQDQKKAFKHATIGIWISICLCYITVIVSVMYFSEWQLKHIEYSLLSVFKAGELSFVERFDILGVTLWVFLILTTVAVYLWSAKLGIESLFTKQKKNYIYILAIIIFIIAILPLPREYQQKIFIANNYLAYVVIIWPMLLNLFYLFRKKKVQP